MLIFAYDKVGKHSTVYDWYTINKEQKQETLIRNKYAGTENKNGEKRDDGQREKMCFDFGR